MFLNGDTPQLNILTDRMYLNEMNNCNAGNTNITLAPDGRFYVCPAFYYEKAENEFMGLGGPPESPFSIGDLESGLNIKNPQLYKLSYAPLCRICDSYQCKRCIWLNRKMTNEVNTPSREQCVASHFERNASRELLGQIQGCNNQFNNLEIKEIDYIDPFEVKKEW